MKATILLALLSLALQAQVKVERVFGPEIKTGPYKHPASICALDNGDLLITYYGGEGEYATSTAVFLSRLKAGATQWTAPRIIAQDPLRSAGNGVAWQSPDGRVWLFYVIRFGDTWSNSRIAVKVSSDRGETWSDSSLLRLEEGWMVRGKPITLSSGEWLLPIYHETGADRERVAPDSASLFLLYNPKTKAWTPTGRIRSANGNIQPSPVELSPGHLLAYCRRGGGYEPSEKGWIVSATSSDGGRTWSEGRNTELPNPNSAVELIKLAGGKLLLVYNPSMSDRVPLTVAISEDNGKTWPRKLDIAKGPGGLAYPSAVQTRDGVVHIVYTSDDRKVIRHATLRESDVPQVR
ncbi:MAG: exo-alpha-sialidase [Acidobacteria bacterium]|nr:exo-alpha-sialidase [Acidobacteriota bacterium]